MHVERYGHGGQPVVLIHGFGTSAFLWRAIGPALAEEGFSAYALDLFGHGESDRPFDANFGIAAQAEYVDRAMTALRLPSAMVVGVDLGGGVALRLAVTRPDRVERLVLINSVAFDALPGRDIRTLQRNTARFLFRVSRGVMGAASLLRPVLEGSVADPRHMPPRLVARYLAPFVGKDGVRHLLALASSARGSELEGLPLETVRVPVLIVWGEEDRWLDDRLPERLASALPQARLERLAAVARLSPEEAPERLTQLLVDFLREPRPG